MKEKPRPKERFRSKGEYLSKRQQSPAPMFGAGGIALGILVGLLYLVVSVLKFGFYHGPFLASLIVPQHIDYSRQVEIIGEPMHYASYSTKPPPKPPPTLPTLHLLSPVDVTLADSFTLTSYVTSSLSEAARGQVVGLNVSASPSGPVAPAAPSYNSWKWQASAGALGQVQLSVFVGDTSLPMPLVATNTITVRDEFGLTKFWHNVASWVFAAISFVGFGGFLVIAGYLGSRLLSPKPPKQESFE